MRMLSRLLGRSPRDPVKRRIQFSRWTGPPAKIGDVVAEVGGMGDWEIHLDLQMEDGFERGVNTTRPLSDFNPADKPGLSVIELKLQDRTAAQTLRIVASSKHPALIIEAEAPTELEMAALLACAERVLAPFAGWPVWYRREHAVVGGGAITALLTILSVFGRDWLSPVWWLGAYVAVAALAWFLWFVTPTLQLVPMGEKTRLRRTWLMFTAAVAAASGLLGILDRLR